VAQVLKRVRHWPLRHPLDFLELPGGHEAAGQREIPEQDLGDERDHPERTERRGPFTHAQVELRGPDQARRCAAERVRERGPLWHRREWNTRQRNAEDESRDDRQDVPDVMDEGWLVTGAEHRPWGE